MILMIDDQISQLQSHAIELTLRGYEVLQISSAREAMDKLSSISFDELEVAVVDVMLAAGPGAEELFGNTSANYQFETGLHLVSSILSNSAFQFKSNQFVFFSMANQDWLINAIYKKSSELNVKYIDKRSHGSPAFFADVLEGIIGARNGL